MMSGVRSLSNRGTQREVDGHAVRCPLSVLEPDLVPSGAPIDVIVPLERDQDVVRTIADKYVIEWRRFDLLRALHRDHASPRRHRPLEEVDGHAARMAHCLE
jgi:hypothetical protein